VWAWRKPGIKSWLRPEATISQNPQKHSQKGSKRVKKWKRTYNPLPKPPKVSKRTSGKWKKVKKGSKRVKKCLIQFLTRPPLKRLRNFWGFSHFDRQTLKKLVWRRKWQSTPGLLPGKSHGQRSLVGYSPWGCKELDTTEQLHFHLIFIVNRNL